MFQQHLAIFYKSRPSWFGSYTHGSQGLMVPTEIIKNWGGGQNGGAENNLGGAFAPPLAPLWRRHWVFV